MLFRKDDLAELETYIDNYRNSAYLEEDPSQFFGERPYFLLPGRFEESRLLYLRGALDWYSDTDPLRAFVERAVEDTRHFMQTVGLAHNDFMNAWEYAFKKGDSGVWYWFDGIRGDDLLLHGPHGKDQVFPLDEIVRTVLRAIESPDEQSHSIVYPRYYIDLLSHGPREDLRLRTVETLRRLYLEQEPLENISPGLLEDIVAELLVAMGLKIFQTPRTHDGGRDIVAKGELAPGLFVHMAVEVKRKSKVGIPDVSRALHANRDFPKIMIVTTGSFTANVYRTRVRDEYSLRLELADGVALSQLIRGYGDRFFAGDQEGNQF